MCSVSPSLVLVLKLHSTPFNAFHCLCDFKCRHSLCVASTCTACSYFSTFQVKRQKETKRSYQWQIKKKGLCGCKCVVYSNSLNRHLVKVDTSKADTWSWSLLYFSHFLHLPPRRTPLQGQLKLVLSVATLEGVDCTLRNGKY